jgi:hypothetical protein
MPCVFNRFRKDDGNAYDKVIFLMERKLPSLRNLVEGSVELAEFCGLGLVATSPGFVHIL